jgi:hypothetical protein
MKLALPAALVALALGVVAGGWMERRRAKAAEAPAVAAEGASREAAPGSAADAAAHEIAAAREEIRALREKLAAATNAPNPGAAMTPEQLAAKAAELRARIPALVAANDERGLIKLMRELASLGEPGYAAAIEIAEILHNELGISDSDSRKVYTGRLLPLLLWTLSHGDKAPAWLRETAIDTLSWADGEIDSTAVYLEALKTEGDAEVAEKFAQYLQDLKPEHASDLLAAVHAQAGHPTALVALAGALAELRTPDTVHALESLSASADESRLMTIVCATAGAATSSSATTALPSSPTNRPGSNSPARRTGRPLPSWSIAATSSSPSSSRARSAF